MTTPPREVPLEPCPHCDSPAEISREDRRDSSTTSVHCSVCGNQGFTYEWLGSPVEAEQKAIDDWNTRTPTPEQPAQGMTMGERFTCVSAGCTALVAIESAFLCAEHLARLGERKP